MQDEASAKARAQDDCTDCGASKMSLLCYVTALKADFVSWTASVPGAAVFHPALLMTCVATFAKGTAFDLLEVYAW